jgi:hypothetical protein
MSAQRWTREELAQGLGEQPWYAVRCVFRTGDEGITRSEAP